MKLIKLKTLNDISSHPDVCGVSLYLDKRIDTNDPTSNVRNPKLYYQLRVQFYEHYPAFVTGGFQIKPVVQGAIDFLKGKFIHRDYHA